MNRHKKHISSTSFTALVFIIGFLSFSFSQSVMAVKLSPEIEIFISKMVKNHGFNEPELKKVFNKTKFHSGIIKAITRPSTSKPWHKYRPIFINQKRITKGITFWNKNTKILEQASIKFGVPEEIIVAIIGVETYYGKQTGRYRVLDALTTLAFNYPRRADFFRNELEQYLLLIREQNAKMFSFKGSYAGAIGIPQFMPSSYRNYAVDFDNDGKIDLSGNTADSIASVANYLAEHGWETGGLVASRAKISDKGRHETLKMGHMPLYTINKMKEFGITPLDDMPKNSKATLIKLENKDHMEYWLGFNNFYVITRYNRSTHYAMSVLLLSEEIRALRKRKQ